MSIAATSGLIVLATFLTIFLLCKLYPTFMTYFLLFLLFAFFLTVMIALVYDANNTPDHNDELWEQRDIHIPGLRRPTSEDIHDQERLKYWQDIYDHQNEHND
jgi:hypothetical protein